MKLKFYCRFVYRFVPSATKDSNVKNFPVNFMQYVMRTLRDSLEQADRANYIDAKRKEEVKQ